MNNTNNSKNESKAKTPWIAIIIMLFLGLYWTFGDTGIILRLIGIILLICAFVTWLGRPKKQEKPQEDIPTFTDEPTAPKPATPKPVTPKPATPPVTPQPAAPQPVAPAPAPVQKIDHSSVEYFKNILSKYFDEFEVRENIPVTEIAGFANDKFQLYKTRPYQAYKAEWGQPYTLGLYQDNEIKGVIMIGPAMAVCKGVKYLIAKMYAKKCNIPYITFFKYEDNERDYVIDRISKFMYNN